MELTKVILEFGAKILYSWPLFFFIIFLFLFYKRTELSIFLKNLLGFLSDRNAEIQVGNLKILLNDIVKDSSSVKNDVDLIIKKGSNNNTDINDSINQLFPEKDFQQLAKLSVKGLIIESWLPIENELQNIYATAYNNKIKYFPIPKIITTLTEDSLISKNYSNQLLELNTLRNKVLHDTNNQLSQDDAIQYAKLCKNYYIILNNLYNTL